MRDICICGLISELEVPTNSSIIAYISRAHFKGIFLMFYKTSY